MKAKKKYTEADLFFYIRKEKKLLVYITISGILYNVGMGAGPWFEGQLAQALADILQGNRTAISMVRLAIVYAVVIFIVQLCRYWKRLYVRRFANDMNRDMKAVLYRSLLAQETSDHPDEEAGQLLTKAVADVDSCVEGVRKFVTEIFDTGVAMAVYIVMLVGYDWRLALLSMAFPPVAYFLAAKLRTVVTRASAAAKESAGTLNGRTLDRLNNAVTYRVYGQESNQNARYEEALGDYEKKSAVANILSTSMEPLYYSVSMLSVIFILYFGARNVTGTGWSVWNIASFTTFLACFTKLAKKSSTAAKLFNSVQKAQVSWGRIHPLMKETKLAEPGIPADSAVLDVSHVTFHYPGGPVLLKDVSFTAHPGEIIGVTGAVASGKSTLGKLFLEEHPYEGKITFDGIDLRTLNNDSSKFIVGYMGHDPQLFSATVEENIRLGKEGPLDEVLSDVCMDEDLKTFQNGLSTRLGTGGVRLSGGQQARVALARALFHDSPVLVLDDPLSAVDPKTEARIMDNLRRHCRGRIIILISHRLSQFPKMDQVLFVKDGHVEVSTHERLMQEEPQYRHLVEMQTKGGDLDA